ncbi:MAG TPA: sigma-70 family RNA polymerase sigma factor [Pyrinomonadaceae bacterium]|nr:sigma-70 family RNA polymerase sigma factor [Pyrinomonadaceae bacterium]
MRLADEYGTMSEIDLARQAAGGDESAFAEIVKRFSPRVFSYSARFFKRHSLVEEAAQEVFLKAYTQLANYEGRGSLEGWLTRITVTTCINILRSTKPQSELTVSELSDDESEWLEERLMNAASLDHQTHEDKLIAADLVWRVLETLPPDESFLIQMLEGEGATVKEVARMTGWSEAKIKTKAFRVRRRMRESIQKLLNAKDGRLRKG